MPLELGRTTTYDARFGFDGGVEPVSVTRRLSVAGVSGFELTGPFGVSRLGWRGDVLYADETANAWFTPSIPILAEDGRPRSWYGRITSLGRTRSATAELVQKPAKVDVGGQSVDTTLATLTVHMNTDVLVLDSWYQADSGLVQQEQRTSGNLVSHIQMVTAP